MAEYIKASEAYDYETLCNWYVSSVSGDSPHWTKEHIEELLSDFLVFPKDTSYADVKPVVHGKWAKQPKDFDLCGVEYFACSQCGFECQLTYNFCPNCGADMRRGDDE